jgi:hypothetical protein
MARRWSGDSTSVSGGKAATVSSSMMSEISSSVTVYEKNVPGLPHAKRD